MEYLGRFTAKDELRKIGRGKKSKLPTEIVVYESLRDWPAMQRQLAKALDITEG